MSDGFGSWDGGGFTDGSEGWSYGYGADTGTQGADGGDWGESVIILPNGEQPSSGSDSAGREYGGSTGGGTEQIVGSGGDETDVFNFSGDLLGIAAEAQEEMVSLVGTDEGVGDVDKEVEPAEEESGNGEEISPSPTPTPVITTDPVLTDIYQLLYSMDVREQELQVHYHNMELFSVSVIGLLAMGFGGMICYGFLRRILT